MFTPQILPPLSDINGTLQYLSPKIAQASGASAVHLQSGAYRALFEAKNNEVQINHGNKITIDMEPRTTVNLGELCGTLLLYESRRISGRKFQSFAEICNWAISNAHSYEESVQQSFKDSLTGYSK